MQATTWLRPAALTLIVAAGLAACGGHHDDDNGNGNVGAAQNDSFFAEVSRIIGTTSEVSEPVAIDGITATAPEASEATPII